MKNGPLYSLKNLYVQSFSYAFTSFFLSVKFYKKYYVFSTICIFVLLKNKQKERIDLNIFLIRLSTLQAVNFLNASKNSNSKFTWFEFFDCLTHRNINPAKAILEC